MRLAPLAVGLALVGALAAPASAGTRIAAVTRPLDDSQKGPQSSEMRIEGQRMRVDPDGRNSVIYRADRGLVWLVDHREKTYMEVNRGTTSALAGRLERANQELRDRIRDLPPEQQAAMERMLNGALGPPPDARPPVSVRDTGRSDEVSGVDCRVQEVLRGQERMAEICTATFAAAGVPEESFAVVRDLASFLRESVGSLVPGGLKDEGLSALESLDGMDGVPMRVRAYEKGRAVSETVLTEIAQEAVPDATFELPSGYQAGFSTR